jgi:hypothetical protein
MRRSTCPEQAVGRGALARLLPRLRGRVVGERVAGVDLDHVVHERHADHARHVDPVAGVLRQHHGRQREVPRVLGAVLAPRAVAQGRLAQHALEAVHLHEEGELARDRRRRAHRHTAIASSGLRARSGTRASAAG